MMINRVQTNYQVYEYRVASVKEKSRDKVRRIEVQKAQEEKD